MEKKLKKDFVLFDGVSKIYKSGENIIRALDGASFEVAEGEFCVVLGPSGAGKTTLLNILGGMDSLDEGKIYLDGSEISSYNQRKLTEYRRYDIGFVFQFYNLVQNLTALENVELASEICKNPLDAAQTLGTVGLSERMYNFPAQLSGGYAIIRYACIFNEFTLHTLIGADIADFVASFPERGDQSQIGSDVSGSTAAG